MAARKSMSSRIRHFLGIDLQRISHTERLVSALGAFFGILAVVLVSTFFVRDSGAFLVVASMGASAVLLFAVPHGALSQPWALVGGHLSSAVVGVACASWVPDATLAAPLAVGLAVGLMHYLRCIHPPGGATALTAVVGGAAVSNLGFAYVLTPVMINVAAILVIAVVFNYFFSWRRYPAYLARRLAPSTSKPAEGRTDHVAREDFVYALSEIDSIIDVTESDLLAIYDLVMQSRESSHFDPDKLELGHYYSNGKYGEQWSVRRIVDWAEGAKAKERLIYRVVAGEGRRSSGVNTLAEFARWAKYEVVRDEENWRRISDPQ
jgi:CBS domain-containing membrane protein